ncbi:MAG: prepilin-type N-terminal cleavage/methylation domain-containing protein [Phycisphaerae bacterium]|nr:prepilin-type N-terminal cleavage/methylation domain-containing protein [Phycisphaerae bacterium]
MLIRKSKRSSAFTLVEVITALAIMTILTTGLASALVLATRALPETDSPLRCQVRTADALDLIAEELASAIQVLARSDHGITFLAPDRNGDGVPEKIVYAWSGTPGDPLTRQAVGSLQENVLEDVTKLEFRYDTADLVETYPAPLTESAEQVLASWTNTAALNSGEVDASNSWGQLFIPAVSAPAVSFMVTRVRLFCEHNGTADGTALLSILPAEGSGAPQFTSLAQGKILESELPSAAAWFSIPVNSMLPVPRGQRLCFTVTTADTAGKAITIHYDNDSVVQGGGAILSRTGGTWTVDASQALVYEVYGKTYANSGATQSITRRYLRRVQLSAQSGPQDESAVLTGTTFGNRPEDLTALWRADFSSKPTLDLNGDTYADWTVNGGGAFSGLLSGGNWTPGAQQLNSYPDNEFSSVTTVDVHARAATAGASAVFQISPDWTLSSAGSIRAVTRLEATGTQTLEVLRATSASAFETVVRVTDLPKSAFVRLRLVIDPTRDTCAVWVNEIHRRTFTYATFLHLTQDKYASLSASGGSAQFDWVSIRVGGTPG